MGTDIAGRFRQFQCSITQEDNSPTKTDLEKPAAHKVELIERLAKRSATG